MEHVIIYLLKANGLLIFFMIFYKLLLQKETFYKFNRFYFLGAVLISIFSPFIYATKIETIFIPNSNADKVVDKADFVSIPIETINGYWYQTIDWLFVLLSMIAVVSVVKIVLRLFNIFLMIRLIRSFEAHPTEKNIQIATNSENVYSFYKWIILPKEYLNDSNTQVLIQHEKIHLKQKHTFDLVILSFVMDIFWFNPFLKEMRKDVNLNLEYLVDNEMIYFQTSYIYQKTLINHCKKQQVNVMVNAFSSNDLKKRIIQLNTKKSKNMRKLKILIASPVLFAFFGLFQIKTIAQVVNLDLQEDLHVNLEETKTLEVVQAKDYDKNEASFYIIIHSLYDDAYYTDMKKKLKSTCNLDIVVSDLIRTSKGELNTLILKWNEGKTLKIHKALGINDKAFTPFKLHVFKDGSAYKIEVIENRPTKKELAENETEVQIVDAQENVSITSIDQELIEDNNEEKPYFVYNSTSIKQSKTEDRIVTENPVDFYTSSNNTIILLNGKKLSKLESDKIKVTDIQSISVSKDKDELAKYGKDIKSILTIKLNDEKKAKNKNDVTSMQSNSKKSEIQNFELTKSIFTKVKKVKKLEDDSFKITSISVSLTQEDGSHITLSENY